MTLMVGSLMEKRRLLLRDWQTLGQLALVMIVFLHHSAAPWTSLSSVAELDCFAGREPHGSRHWKTAAPISNSAPRDANLWATASTAPHS